MMKFKKLFPKNSKEGVTLIEVVLGVVVLSIIAVGIITALSTGSTTIKKKATESVVHSEAVQRMDAVIATISNGNYKEVADVAGTVKTELGFNDITLTATADTYRNIDNVDVIRGWKLSLTYKGQTVTGYASNTEGVFDQE